MIVHYFLVDYGNSGDIYDIGCVGDLDALKKYWQGISRDVRYKYTQELHEFNENGKPRRLPKGYGKLGNAGYAVSCKFFCEFPQSITRSMRLKYFDERYKFVD